MTDFKTTLGDVRFADLFTDLILAPQVVTPDRGSYCLAPQGHLFLSMPRGITTRKLKDGFYLRHTTLFVYAKPTREALDAAEMRCVNDRVGSFEIVPWPHAGKALVVAHDRSGIGAPYLCKPFVAHRVLLVKAMAPEVRKAYKARPKAISHSNIYGLSSRTNFFMPVADLTEAQVRVVLKEFFEPIEAKMKAKASLEAVVKGVTTLKQLKEALPELEKYMPQESVATANLPATLAVAELVKAGWKGGAKC